MSVLTMNSFLSSSLFAQDAFKVTVLWRLTEDLSLTEEVKLAVGPFRMSSDQSV